MSARRSFVTASEAGPDKPIASDRLLDVQEAAAMLGLKPATLYDWAYRRKLPVVKPSGPRGPLRFRLSTLLNLIDEWERPALRSLHEKVDGRRRAGGVEQP